MTSAIRLVRDRRVLMVLSVALVVAVLTVVLLRSSSPDGPGSVLIGNDEGATHEYVVTAGTAERLQRGEPVNILPAEIDFRVGDSIRIRNDDTTGSVVGPFYVDANSVMTQRFTSAGTYSGLCSVHPSGKIDIHVRA